MTEAQYTDYFKMLAENHKLIKHNTTKKAFFYIELIEELTEFDQALRNMHGDIAVLLTGSSGEFNDGNSNSYTDDITAQLYIVMRKKSNQSVAEINLKTKSILIDFLARARKENSTKFRIQNLPYTKVAGMNDVWYGYTAMLTFSCPFGFSLDNGTWLDK